MEKNKQTEHDHEGHHSSASSHVEGDIKVNIGPVSLIVYNNGKSILIQGEKTKIEFDLPIEAHPLKHQEEDHTHDEHPHGNDVSKKHEHVSHEQNDHEEDTIDLSCEGIQILLCECCTILKIKGDDVDLNFPLKVFQKANTVLSVEGDYYVREYLVKILKHMTNESDQKLYVNNKQIEFEYVPAIKAFTTHLFFRSYNNVLDILTDYLKANPDLNEFKHH